MEKTIRIQNFLDDNRISPFQWLIFLACFLVAFFDGMDTAAIGYIAPSLSDDWGIGKQDLAPVLSAALFGLAAGAVTSGPLADKFGRKPVLTVSVLVFSGFCTASAFAGNLWEMGVLRFITGLGLGAAMPNAVTLLSEYCPARKRAMIVNTMYCGFPLGAAAGGFFAAWIIPEHGWRTALLWCGLVPLALGVLMVFLMPRSAVYLAAKQKPAAQIRRLLLRINPNADLDNARFSAEVPQPSAAGQGSPIGMVLGAYFRAGSVLLWLSYFFGLIIFYGLINWLPILFKEANMSAELGARVSGLFALGGLGAVASGYLMDKFNGNKLVALLALLSAASVALIGWAMAQGVAALAGVILFAGVVYNTMQASLPALAAQFYPVECRSTGVSWMLGIGRFGAIAGTFLTGQLLAWKLDYTVIFMILALPALVVTACLLIKQKRYG